MKQTMIYGEIMNSEPIYSYKSEQTYKKNIIASRIFALKCFEFPKQTLTNIFRLTVPVVMLWSFELIADEKGTSFPLTLFSKIC